MEHKNIYQLVLAGVLCAIGLVVPMVMPKVIIGPMSFTLGAHAAIFLAMFILPKVAAAVCLGTTMGFFVTTPLIIAARAATHIIFALVGALIIRRYPNIMESFVAGIGLNLGLAVLHALGEVLVVAPLLLQRLYVYARAAVQWFCYECYRAGGCGYCVAFGYGLQYFRAAVEICQSSSTFY